MKHLLFAVLLSFSVILSCPAFQADDVSKNVLSDGSYSDTSKAVAYVIGKGQDGWVLTVGAPGATYIWASALVFSSPNIFTIQGASTNNRPTIMLAAPVRSAIYFSASKLVTIKDFIFNVAPTGPTGSIMNIDGTGVCFRISNCEFLNASTGVGTGTAFGIGIGSINATHAPGPYGLVDHCQFYFPGGVVYNYLNVFANGNVDNWCWTQPMTWGTTNSVVVESCAFSQPHSAPASGLVEAMGGARITLRYNNITNIPESTHGMQSGSHSSTLQIECYQNHWMLNDANNTMSYLILQRGGTAVIWSNTVAETSFWNLGGVCQFWVECAATTLWQSEWCSSELFYPKDYPAPQQIGQGVVNGASGSMPVYAWGNNFPGTSWGNFSMGRDGGDGPFIKQGRDIFTNSVMPNYTPLVFPHPLVALGGTPPGNFIGTTNGSSAVIPPTDLQAHPPAGQ